MRALFHNSMWIVCGKIGKVLLFPEIPLEGEFPVDKYLLYPFLMRSL